MNGCFYTNLAGENEMESPYDGNPPVPDLKPDYIFRLALVDKDGEAVYLDLPASLYVLNKVAQRMGEENLNDCRFFRCDGSIKKVNEALNGNESIYDLNDFAETLQSMCNDWKWQKYKAVLEITPCSSLEDFIALADSLDNYEYNPETISSYDYGEQELSRQYGLNRTSAGMEHFDFAAFGKERMEQAGVRVTPYGMIRKIDTDQILTHDAGQGQTM